jgi:hypothetical protein
VFDLKNSALALLAACLPFRMVLPLWLPCLPLGRLLAYALGKRPPRALCSRRKDDQFSTTS